MPRRPDVDLSRINDYKNLFLLAARAVCPEFELRERDKPFISDIFDWCMMNDDGVYDPDKGLFIWGNIGTGKSTLLQIIRIFTNIVRPVNKDGQPYNFRIYHASDVAFAYSNEDGGGYQALIPFIKSQRIAFDELGNEERPARHYGKPLNVFEHIFLHKANMRFEGFWHATSNMEPSQLGTFYGDRNFDRAKEMVNFVEMRGKTHRSCGKRIKDVIPDLVSFYNDPLTQRLLTLRNKWKDASRTNKLPK